MAKDKFKIDGHKLMYHVDRLMDWCGGKIIYPIYMEISPSGACNHRCSYCGLDFMEYRKRFLETKLLKERLSELGRLGLKSVMYAGEGEPLLHKDIEEIVQHTRTAGIDPALTTNGVLLTADRAEGLLRAAKWIKVSINAGTAETYARIHGTGESDFDKVVGNMTHAVEVRRDKGFECTLGMQLVLLDENAHEAVQLAQIAKDIGMDYLVIKPYSQHPQSKTTVHKDVRYSDYAGLAAELERFNSRTAGQGVPGLQRLERFNGEHFEVIFRAKAMAKWDDRQRRYDRCLALPFWSYIDAAGDVWGCSVYLGDERFRYGNIYHSTFEDIWQSTRRLKSLRWIESQWDASQCRVNCRMDEINTFLWELRHPPAHVNFI